MPRARCPFPAPVAHLPTRRPPSRPPRPTFQAPPRRPFCDGRSSRWAHRIHAPTPYLPSIHPRTYLPTQPPPSHWPPHCTPAAVPATVVAAGRGGYTPHRPGLPRTYHPSTHLPTRCLHHRPPVAVPGLVAAAAGLNSSAALPAALPAAIIALVRRAHPPAAFLAPTYQQPSPPPSPQPSLLRPSALHVGSDAPTSQQPPLRVGR